MATVTTTENGIYGIVAEFDNATDVVHAAEAVYKAGYRKIDGYAPFPLEELSEAVGFHKNRVSMVCLIGALIGCAAGFGLATWVRAINYPLIIGGKPFFSWPAFIPVTFETTVLLSALSTAIGMLIMNGLPQPYHPLFNVPQFSRASDDRFFVCIEARDPKFDPVETRRFLEGLHPISVEEVPE
jgi:hypothetical protein